MKVALHNNQDFFAGLMFTAIGLGALVMALKYYPLGTTFRMGPGFFPAVSGGLLILLGIYTTIRGIRRGRPIEGAWGIRPLFLITLGVVAFGVCMERLGMLPALAVMFFLTTFGGREFKFTEVLVLTIVMTAAAWGIFVFGLGLPFRLFIPWGV